MILIYCKKYMKMVTIKEIIKNMTLEQKAAQLVQIPYSQVGREKAEEWAKRGVGSFLHVFGDEAKHLQELPYKAEQRSICYSE